LPADREATAVAQPYRAGFLHAGILRLRSCTLQGKRTAYRRNRRLSAVGQKKTARQDDLPRRVSRRIIRSP